MIGAEDQADLVTRLLEPQKPDQRIDFLCALTSRGGTSDEKVPCNRSVTFVKPSCNALTSRGGTSDEKVPCNRGVTFVKPSCNYHAAVV